MLQVEFSHLLLISYDSVLNIFIDSNISYVSYKAKSERLPLWSLFKYFPECLSTDIQDILLYYGPLFSLGLSSIVV